MLIRHNPLRELDQLMESFDSILGSSPVVNATTNVPLDIFEKEGNLFVRASLPGINPEDLEIAVERDVLTLRGETKAEWETNDARVYRRESRYGRFARSIRLPEGYSLDQADASFENGVVQVRIPKVEVTAQEVKRIPLRTGNSVPAPALETGEEPKA